MEGGTAQQPSAQSALSGLIRPEQVGRLPQLNQQQKVQYQQLVSKMWEVMNSIKNPADPRYQQAQQKLVATSAQLMNGMKQFRAQQAQMAANANAAAGQSQAVPQAQRPDTNQMQAQQAGGAAAAAAAAAQPQSSNIQFSQLLPEIQQKVNEQHFYFPPATVEGTKAADDWLREAKARYGQALQRAHMARNKKLEFQRTFTQREQSGNPLNPQEREVYQNKIAQCTKAINESSSFMEKFREQQAGFQRQQAQNAQQRFTNQAVPASASGNEGQTQEQAVTTTVNTNTQGAPNAHSITSAVNAARNAAALAAQAGSPSHAHGTTATGTPTTAQNPMGLGQSPIHTQNSMDHSRPSSAHPSQSVHPPALHSQSSAHHAHPLSAINGIKPQGPAITRDLQVAETKPVQMPPSRPTLNGGAGVGLPGQLGQPALTALPGYVLETGEDGHCLSKKRLRELIREVCGPGADEQVTPEAEEVSLKPL